MPMPKAAAFGELTSKQSKLVMSLLEGHTMTRAAKDAGIAERTARGYMAMPQVREAYREGRLQAVDKALAKIQIASEAAVNRILFQLQDNPGITVARSRVQLAAAEVVLKIALESVGMALLAQRLDELEAVMQEQGYDLKKVRGAHGHLRPIR